MLPNERCLSSKGSCEGLGLMAVAPASSIDAIAHGFPVAQTICRKEAKNFYHASVFLPRPKRQAACAIYAFCKMVEEATEMPAAESAAGASSCSGDSLDSRLALINERVQAIYDETLELPRPE